MIDLSASTRQYSDGFPVLGALATTTVATRHAGVHRKRGCCSARSTETVTDTVHGSWTMGSSGFSLQPSAASEPHRTATHAPLLSGFVTLAMPAANAPVLPSSVAQPGAFRPTSSSVP